MQSSESGHEFEATSQGGATCVDVSKVLWPINLPCGRVVPNRLVKVRFKPLHQDRILNVSFVSKAATYEHLAPLFGGLPTWAHYVLYGKWGKGEWGMVTTGNVQVSSEHLTLGCDLVIPEHLTPDVFHRYTLLAAFMKGLTPSRSHRPKDDRVCPLAIMQLSHAGRQSTNIVGGRWPFQSPLGPSATRVGGSSSQSDGLLNRLTYGLMFQEARAMTIADIKSTVDAFVRGAKVAEECGFDGIQLHAAHGCAFIYLSTGRLISYNCRPHLAVHIQKDKSSHRRLWVSTRILTHHRFCYPKVCSRRLYCRPQVERCGLHD